MAAVIEVFLDLLGIYAALGAMFAIAFVGVGAGRVDPVATVSTLGFRIMIFPGVVALWPLMLARWITRWTRAGGEE